MSKTTTIIVREQRHFHTGRSQQGTEFNVYQLVATKADGAPIDKNLRTFDVLPQNVPVEVTVDRFVSEQTGAESFTVKPVGKHTGGLEAQVEELRGRLVKVEGALAALQSHQRASGPPPPPPRPSAPAPVAADGPNDDVPF